MVNINTESYTHWSPGIKNHCLGRAILCLHTFFMPISRLQSNVKMQVNNSIRGIEGKVCKFLSLESSIPVGWGEYSQPSPFWKPSTSDTCLFIEISWRRAGWIIDLWQWAQPSALPLPWDPSKLFLDVPSLKITLFIKAWSGWKYWSFSLCSLETVWGT